ncbi:MAG: phage holin family protein [Oscillospiraceae bacterium]|nr:phage holin family protein [Oscillospiraceae bacterium]
MKINWMAALTSAAAILGSWISFAFGGLDGMLWTLLAFMAADYITGIVVAAVFHKSNKSESGALNSEAGWQGLVKKGGVLLVVLVAAALDRVLGTDAIRDGAVLAFLVNETVSLIENAGLMGVPIPAALQKAIEVLRDRSESGDTQ